MKTNTVFFTSIILLSLTSMSIISCGNANKPSSGTEQKASTSTIGYSCPMHPEVTSDKPGKCPKCGMQLEQKTIPAKDSTKMKQADSAKKM